MAQLGPSLSVVLAFIVRNSATKMKETRIPSEQTIPV